MHSPQRLRYPLRRVGPRGSGTWKRISWDEALDQVADGIIDAATGHGTETVFGSPGPNFDHGPDSAAEFRFLRLLGPSVTRRVARDMAAAKAALIYASTGACKHYHSDLMHRSFALLMALTGNQGKPGGGLRFGSWWGVSGFDQLGFGELPAWQKLALRLAGRPAVRDIEAYIFERARQEPFTRRSRSRSRAAGRKTRRGSPAACRRAPGVRRRRGCVAAVS